jgi:hypothetical protein
MTDLLWIWLLVWSLGPTFSPDLVTLIGNECCEVENDADPDHHRQCGAIAALAAAVRHFFGREKVNTTLQIGGLDEMCRLVESELLKLIFFYVLET